MKYELAETPEGLWHYVHDIPEREGPLLDEIEFKDLCDDLIDGFNTPYPPNERDGCFTAILGPANVPGFPVWADGRYTDLSVREAKMMAIIIRDRLGLIYDPDNGAHAWSEVATGRFLVSSRDDVIVPSPYPARWRR